MGLNIYNTDSYQILQIPNGYRGISNEYFSQFCTFHGIPIIAPALINEYALKEARYILERMFENCEHRISPLRENGLFVAIMPEALMTDAAGMYNPLREQNYSYAAVGEDNILTGYSSVLIHEIAHALHHSLSQFEKEIILEYFEASKAYYKSDAYAVQNVYEYFAESVGAYFCAGTLKETINNRKALQVFDSKIYHYVDGIFGNTPYIWTPVAERKDDLHLIGYKPKEI